MKHAMNLFRLQCWIIGVHPWYIDPTEPNWFMKHSWSYRRERIFQYLMVLYLWLSPAARKELLKFDYFWKGNLMKAAKEWSWNFGWKHKKSEKRF